MWCAPFYYVAMMGGLMLRISHATCSIGDHVVMHGVDLAVAPGEIVALCGANGSGKSSLARALCGLIALQEGTVTIDADGSAAGTGASACALPGSQERVVGYVQQDPADSIIANLVFDEVAFGPRASGLDEAEVSQRVHDALARVGLKGFESRDTGELSGGEQQRLAIAGALALHPRYLVLDEVTSMLDTPLRAGVRSCIRSLSHDDGMGILMITHDAVEVLSADRVVVMAHGAVTWEGIPHELVDTRPDIWSSLIYETPYARMARSAVLAGASGDVISNPTRLGTWLANQDADSVQAAPGERFGPIAPKELPPHDGGLIAQDVSFSYEDGGTGVLNHVDLHVPKGLIALLVGPSGSGKSTLAGVLAGLLEPADGTVELDGRAVHLGDVAYACQRPEDQLFLDTVFDELAFAPRNKGSHEDEVRRAVSSAARECGMGEDLLQRYPFALSGGEARRVGIAASISVSSRAVVLDEPTAGLDASGRRALHDTARSLAADGAAVLVISHDVEEWVEVADLAAIIADGVICWKGPASELLASEAPYARCQAQEPDCVRAQVALRAHAPSRKVVAVSGGDVERRSAFPLQPASMDRAGEVRPRARTKRDDGARRQRGPIGARRSRTARLRVLGSYTGAETSAARVDARVKVLLLLAMTATAFAATSPVSLALEYALLCCCMMASNVGPRGLVAALKPVSVILVFTLCANLVSCDGSGSIAAGSVGPVTLGIDQARGLRGLMAVLRIVLLLGYSLVVSASTTATELTDALVRLMRPLSRLRVPVESIGMAASLAIRFIPLVAQELQRIQVAQRVRGVRFEEGGVLERVRRWITVLAPLVAGLFRRADRLADAMTARGFTADAGRQVPARALKEIDVIVLVLGMALMAGLVAASHLGT